MGELEKALRHVAYLNSRQFPTPGVRRLRLTSTARCVLAFPGACLPPGTGGEMCALRFLRTQPPSVRRDKPSLVPRVSE